MLRRIIPLAVFITLAVFVLANPVFALWEGEAYKIGGDFRLRQVFFENIIDTNSDNDDQFNFFRFRLRAFGEYAPTPGFRFYTKITGEPRYFVNPDVADDFARDEFVFDNLFLEFKTGENVKSTTRIGRQDIVQGSRLLILDGTPLDGSRTIYVDAVRQIWKWDNLKIDAFLSRVDSEDPLPKINDQDMLLSEQDEEVHGFLIDGAATDKVKLEGYYYYHSTDITMRKSSTLGGRVIGQINEDVSLTGELATQFGEVEGYDLKNVIGGEAVLTYKPADKSYTPEVKLSYTFLPGDDPTTTEREDWDPVYGRWPRFSELYIYTYIQETSVAYVNNLQIYTLSCGAVPKEKLSVFGAVHYMRANENPLENTRIFGDGQERGWLFVAKTVYKFTPSLNGHLWLEYLKPGNYYAEGSRDNGYFFRYELSWKF